MHQHPFLSQRRLARTARLAAPILLASVVAAGPGPPGHPEPQQPTGAELLSRAVTAMGGRAALGAIRTLHLSGTTAAFGGFVGRFEAWHAAPDRMRAVWDLDFYRQERGYDGRAGWERIAGPRELVGRDLERIRRSALLFPLLRHLERGTPAGVEGTEQVTGRRAWLVRLSPPDGGVETWAIDAETHLPLRETRQAPYEEGPLAVTTEFGDYRAVGAVRLPHRIEVAAPDLYYGASIERYRVNAAAPDSLFTSPVAPHAGAPYQVTLATLPHRIYKVPDGTVDFDGMRSWGIPFQATESWTFDLMVNERHGRHVRPRGAVLGLYAGATLVREERIAGPTLEAMQAFPATRFGHQPEIYHFRHTLTAAADPSVDRVVYTLDAATPAGEAIEARLEIPVSRYRQKNRLIFPIKGKFIVPNGHEFYELQHKYEWSQQFAYDIVGLGPDFELARNDAREPTDYHTVDRELLAPAAGVVVYARNDIPDGAPRSVFQTLPDPMWSFAGNSVLIDHGQGEYSFLCHIRFGTVRVRQGDRVTQGQVLGLLGYSATPVPHVHYQLQAGPEILRYDGLPSLFDNTYPVGFLGTGRQVPIVKRGVYMEAR